MTSTIAVTRILVCGVDVDDDARAARATRRDCDARAARAARRESAKAIAEESNRGETSPPMNRVDASISEQNLPDIISIRARAHCHRNRWSLRATRTDRRRPGKDYCFSKNVGLSFSSKEKAEDQISWDRFAAVLLTRVWPSPATSRTTAFHEAASLVTAASSAAVTSPVTASPATSCATAYCQAASLMAAAFPPPRTRAEKKRQSPANEAADHSVTTGKRWKTHLGEDDLRRHNGGNSTRRHVRQQNRPTSGRDRLVLEAAIQRRREKSIQRQDKVAEFQARVSGLPPE